MRRPIRVLLADDTPDLRQMVATMLALDGFEVVGEAGTGTEVVALVSRGVDADVVVVDERMPDLDGVSTARLICAARPEQLVLLYTAFPHRSLTDSANAAGVAAVLGKADGIEALEREIVRLVGERPSG